jgi:acetyl esterase/lipase
MASFRHAALVALFRLTRRKRRYASGEALMAYARKRRKKNRQPSVALDGVVVSRDDSVGFPVFTVAPPGGAGRVGMYVHGGAYVNDLQRQHWTFIADIVRRTRVALMVPQYPLAPEHTWADSFDALLGVVEECLGDKPLLMGDSAGGGYALALAQRLHSGGRTPECVLISPWLDVELETGLESDPWLDVPGLRAAGEWWSAGQTAKGEVSPLRGGWDGLRVLVLCGTRDLLYAQSVALGAPLITGPGLIHCYPLLPIPEAKAARDAVVEFVSARFPEPA